MSEFEADTRVLAACSVILTKNKSEAVRLRDDPHFLMLPLELREEVGLLAQESDTSFLEKVVRMSYWMPVWVQYVSQRAVLLMPRVAHRVIRATRLHHRWY